MDVSSGMTHDLNFVMIHEIELSSLRIEAFYFRHHPVLPLSREEASVEGEQVQATCTREEATRPQPSQ